MDCLEAGDKFKIQNSQITSASPSLSTWMWAPLFSYSWGITKTGEFSEFTTGCWAAAANAPAALECAAPAFR